MRAAAGPSFAFALVLALGAGGWGAPARAHAPLAREIALGVDARAAVRMPEFGWLLRAGARQPFAYACDALLGVQPLQSAVPMLYLQDGSLLVGTAAGLRGFDPRGCPLPIERAGTLAARPIAALARDSSSGDVYAATSGPDAALYVRAPGGGEWQRRAALSGNEALSALRVVADGTMPARVYASVTTVAMGSALLVSEDAGATFARMEQERALTLLLVEPGTPARLWAMGRALDGKRGVEILRADQADGPWASVLRVNFYGGFTRDEHGVLWAGDEGGGVFRSDDGGDSFVEVAPQQATACLAAGTDGLWACTPGSARQRAVALATDASADFADVLSFAAVEQLVECAPEHDVATACAAAWREWQVDVRMMAAAALPDAGASADAGAPEDAAVSDPPGRVPAGGAGCRIAAVHGSARALALWLAFACTALLMRRRCSAASAGSRRCRTRGRAQGLRTPMASRPAPPRVARLRS